MKKRGFGEGRFNGVGGKLDEGETIEQALIRECQEEISVTPISYEKVAVIEFDEMHGNEREELLVHVFTCDEWNGEPVESEEMAPRWFKVSDIPYEDMWPDDIYWLPKVIDGKKLRCRFTLDDKDQITAHEIKEVDAL